MTVAFGASDLTFPTSYVGGTTYAQVVLSDPDSMGVDGTLAVTGDFALFNTDAAVAFMGGSQTVYLSFTPSAAGTRTGTLTYTPTSPSESNPALTVTLTGDARAASGLYVDGDVDSVSFSTVTVGSSLVASVTLRAPTGSGGDYTATINAPGAPFSVSPTGAQTVSEGGFLVLTVEYEPSAVGTHSDSFTVDWTGGGSSGALPISVSGEAIDTATDNDESTADSTSSSSDTNTSTTYQRVVLSIPTAASAIGIGKQFVFDGTTITRDGFTASTQADVKMHADKAVTFQSKDLAWIQSNQSSTYTVAGNRSIWMSDSSVYVAGANYLGMMAGYHGDPTGQSVESIEGGFLAADISWGVFEKLISIADWAKYLHQYIYLDKWNEYDKGFWKFYNRAEVIVKSVYRWGMIIFWVVSRSLGEALKAMSVYSEAGMIIGTPTTTTISSAMIINIRSLSTTIVGLAGVCFESGYSTQVDSVFGETSATAGKTITIKGGKEAKLLSRTNAITINAPEIFFGEIVRTTWPAKPTKQINMEATSEIMFESTAPGVGMVDLKSQLGAGGSLSLSATRGATLSSKKNTVIKAGTMKVELTPGAITITSPLGPVLKLSPAMIQLGPAAGQIKFLQALCDIGNSVKISSANATIMAGRLEIL